MKNKGPKRFKSKREYYQYFAFLLFFGSIVIFCALETILTPEQEYVDSIMSQELIGSGRHRRNIMIEKFLVSNWGKVGMQAFIAITTILLANELYELISAYRRLLFREKLIREGLRAPDDYVDDYVRVPLWRKIANLFTKKRKKKYPSEREMRDSLKKNKYYKE